MVVRYHGAIREQARCALLRMSSMSPVAPVTADDMAKYTAHVQHLEETGAPGWQFDGQGLMYSDWEALQPQLRERGYRLHTLRDWPERTLALLEDGVELEEAELDKIYQNVGSNMGLFESYRLSDNVCVVLKIIIDHPTSREREILEYLNKPELRRCLSNLTIPLLDSFDLTYCGTKLHVLVMKDCSEHAFNRLNIFCKTAEDWYRFILYIFEGYNYMHKLGIAHLDAHPRNILCRHDSHSLSDIHIADFGGSQYFSGPIDEAVCCHPTYLRDLPESPYRLGPAAPPFNPFAADVYGVGASFMECDELNERFTPSSLLDLFRRMMSDVPKERPTMAKALNELRRILLEMLLYPDRHRRTILKECRHETAVEDAGIPLPASPEQHVEDIVQGEHKYP